MPNPIARPIPFSSPRPGAAPQLGGIGRAGAPSLQASGTAPVNPITYQDYVLSEGNKGGDGGSGQGLLTESQWNAMSLEEKFNNTSGGIQIDKNDPRYAGLQGQLGLSGNDQLIRVVRIDPTKPKEHYFKDPSSVVDMGNGVYAFTRDHLTSNILAAEDEGFDYMKLGAFALWPLAAEAIVGGLGGLGAGATPYTGTMDLYGAGAFGGTTPIGAGAGAGVAGTGSLGSLGGIGTGAGTVPFIETIPVTAQALPATGGGAAAGLGAAGAGALATTGGGTSPSTNNNSGNNNLLRSAGGLLLNALGGGGGSSGGFDLNSLLGMFGLGHQAFGNGIGTANGAIDAGNKGAALADPWGTSGRRGEFNKILSPKLVMQMLSQDPSAVLNNPAYKFDLAQGINAINVGDAAQGTLRSGNRLYELQDYGQGLAAKYGQQMFQNNLSSLGVLGSLAGVGASSPTAAAQATTSAWDNASNIRNAAQNGIFRGGSSNPLQNGSLLNLIGQGGSAVWNWLFGSGGGYGTINPADLGDGLPY